MGFKATILADSASPMGKRLTTIEATYPRIVHAEMMTHRMLSRNAASSRAIPVEKLIRAVQIDPFVPESFGTNRTGMQAGAALTGLDHRAAVAAWLDARDSAVARAKDLHAIGVHKQLANRLLEPFQWYTVIISATEWSNFFALRCHPDAQPEIRRIAVLMREAMADSTPAEIDWNDWHLPLVPDLADLRGAGYSVESIKKISAGRCARVSYLTHHGERDPEADIALCERLVSSGHMSPLEHVATPTDDQERNGNFVGWRQMRRDVPNESDFAMANVGNH